MNQCEIVVRKIPNLKFEIGDMVDVRTKDLDKSIDKRENKKRCIRMKVVGVYPYILICQDITGHRGTYNIGDVYTGVVTKVII